MLVALVHADDDRCRRRCAKTTATITKKAMALKVLTRMMVKLEWLPLFGDPENAYRQAETNSSVSQGTYIYVYDRHCH